MSYLENNAKATPTGLSKILYLNWPLLLLISAAMFHHHGHCVFRIVVGREAYEQRVVPTLPRQVFVADYPCGARHHATGTL